MEQLAGGLWPGGPLHLRLWRRLQLGLWGCLWRLCAWTWRLRRGLWALHQVLGRRRCLGLGLCLGLGQWLQSLRAGVFQHQGLEEGLFATVLALLLASL